MSESVVWSNIMLICIGKRKYRLSKKRRAGIEKADQVKAIFQAHQTSSNAITVLMTLAYFL